jgi:hypothetical protein
MRIAILDCMNYDIGLKILFPEAHYYICASEIDKSKSYDKYNFKPKLLENYSSITSSKYDVLFIVLALYDTLPNTKFYKPQVAHIYDKIKREILDVNTFEKVVLFDNYDYDYDPSTIAGTDKIDAFMKRNYNKTKVYSPKVHPFPFIMFGEYSIIEKLDNPYFNRENRHNEIFFSGSLFYHDDPQYPITRHRRIIYEIQEYVSIYPMVSYTDYISNMKRYKYGLDLLGVGDPNKRTFEILASGALRIGQYTDLKWPFEEEFEEDTIFKTAEEFFGKIDKLNNNPDIYNKCLDRQEEIIKKYFNKEWIRGYIILTLGL